MFSTAKYGAATLSGLKTKSPIIIDEISALSRLKTSINLTDKHAINNNIHHCVNIITIEHFVPHRVESLTGVIYARSISYFLQHFPITSIMTIMIVLTKYYACKTLFDFFENLFLRTPVCHRLLKKITIKPTHLN